MREVSVADELCRPGFSETFTGYLHRWFGRCEVVELRQFLRSVSEWFWEQTVPESLRIPLWVSEHASVRQEIDLNGEVIHAPSFGVTRYKRPSIRYARRVMFQIGLSMRSMALHPHTKKFTCRPDVSVNEMYSGRQFGPVGYLCTFHQGSLDNPPATVLAHLTADV